MSFPAGGEREEVPQEMKSEVGWTKCCVRGGEGKSYFCSKESSGCGQGEVTPCLWLLEEAPHAGGEWGVLGEGWKCRKSQD